MLGFKIPVPKPKTKRITINEYRRREGLQNEQSFDRFLSSCVVGDEDTPALCDDGCMVEPDGTCEHGCPSILTAMGIM